MSIKRLSIGLAMLVVTATLGLLGLAVDNYLKEKKLEIFDVEKHRLFSQTFGASDGRKVLFLHGLAASSKSWSPVISQLPDNIQALVPDLLGFGQSPKPVANYDLADHVAALEPVLKRAGFLDGEPMVVAGHSMGNLIALQLLQEYPEQISALVLTSVPTFPSPDSARETLKKVSWMHRGMVTNNPVLKFICYALHGRNWGFDAPAWGLPADVINDGSLHNWVSVSGSLYGSVINVDAEGLIGDTSRPIVFIHGAKDQVAPLDNLKNVLKKLGREKELTIVPQADHSLPLVYPNVIIEQLERVLN